MKRMYDYPFFLAEKFNSCSIGTYPVLMLCKNVTASFLISLYSDGLRL